MRVSVFAPHPDDEIIGCGGSILKLVQAGSDVAVHFLTSGDGGDLRYSRAALGEIREREATAAVQALGVEKINFFRQTDGFLRETSELLADIVNLIRQRRPNLVYVPHANDDHHDHVATHEIVMKSLRIASGRWMPETQGRAWTVETVLAYEVWTPIIRPSYLEDTTDVIDSQLYALDRYTSQLADSPYDQLLQGLSSYRGARLGRGRSAEAFEILSAEHSCYSHLDQADCRNHPSS